MEKLPDLVKEILISQKEIKNLVNKVALEILNNNKDKEEINLVVVLEGAKTFCSDLVGSIKARSSIKINQHYIKIGSYGKNTIGGKISIKKDIEDVAGKSIIIVEDIVDTGKTLKFLVDYLRCNKKVKDIKICSLLSKPERREEEIKIDYLGAEVPDVFIVGYGLDWAGKFRELPYIAALDESKIKK